MKTKLTLVAIAALLSAACSAQPARAEESGHGALAQQVNAACAAEVQICNGQTLGKGLVKCIMAKRRENPQGQQISASCKEALQSLMAKRRGRGR